MTCRVGDSLLDTVCRRAKNKNKKKSTLYIYICFIDLFNNNYSLPSPRKKLPLLVVASKLAPAVLKLPL